MKTIKHLYILLAVMLCGTMPVMAQNTDDSHNKAVFQSTDGNGEMNTDDIQVIRFDGGKVTVVQPWGETVFDRTLRNLTFFRPLPGTLRLTVDANINTEETDGGSNRALDIDGDGWLTATWKEGDQVYVYADAETTTSIGTLTPETQGTSSTSLVGDINATGLTDGQTLYLETKPRTFSFATQTGILSDLFYAKATATVSINGGNATIGKASFARPMAIVKFTLKKKSDGSDLIIPVTSSLTVSDGTSTYTVMPTSATNEFYVGIPGITSGTVTLVTCEGTDIYSFAKTNVTFNNGKYYTISVKMKAEPVGSINLAEINSDCEIQNGYRLYGTLSSNVKISIADGATVTLDGVNINGTNNDSYQWAGVTCNGDAIIILNGENTVKGFQQDYPGISVPVDKTLTINGTGSLNASSYGYGCGIGGRSFTQCGNITIDGGTITSTGGDGCAGIGGSKNGTCGNINITGGNVTASGGNGAAGIGGGYNDSEGDKSTCGDISIIGGTVVATSYNNVSIGGGYNGVCGDITIANTVTQVTANNTSGDGTSRPIGKGYSNGTCGTLTIGGTVYWDGSDFQNGGNSYLYHNPFTYPQLYTCNSSDWSTQVAAFNNESNANPVLQFTSDISTAVHGFVISRSNGIVDLNRYTLFHINLRNNIVGQSVTIKNGTISGDSYYDNAIDGMGGWTDFFKGTVILENLTVQNGIYTDGHEYIIQSGNYQTIHHGTSNGCPGKLIIYGGYFNKTIQGSLQGSAVVGTYELYGGKYAVRPENSWCATGYCVKDNTDDDKATYPWIVGKE